MPEPDQQQQSMEQGEAYNEAPQRMTTPFNSEKVEKSMAATVSVATSSLEQLFNILIMPAPEMINKLFVYSLILSGICSLSTLLQLYTFISWQGALICSVILGFFSVKEKGDQSIITHAYRQASLKLQLGKTSSKKRKTKSKSKSKVKKNSKVKKSRK